MAKIKLKLKTRFKYKRKKKIKLKINKHVTQYKGRKKSIRRTLCNNILLIYPKLSYKKKRAKKKILNITSQIKVPPLTTQQWVQFKTLKTLNQFSESIERQNNEKLEVARLDIKRIILGKRLIESKNMEKARIKNIAEKRDKARRLTKLQLILKLSKSFITFFK